MTVLVGNLNKDGCKQLLGQIEHDRKIIDRGFAQATADEEAARIRILAISHTISILDNYRAEVEERLRIIEAAENDPPPPPEPAPAPSTPSPQSPAPAAAAVKEQA